MSSNEMEILARNLAQKLYTSSKFGYVVTVMGWSPPTQC